MEQNQVTDEEIRNVRNTVVGKDRVEIWSKMLYYLCTELLYLREAKRMALRAAPGADVADDRCPNCWRKKAHSLDDCLDGKCPKWFAVRDSGAEDDCTLFNKAFFSPPAGQGATAEHDTPAGAEAVGTITRSPLLDVEWTDVTQAVKLPIGTKLYTQPAHGEREAEFADLLRFYSVQTLAELVLAQARHVEHLQEKLPPMRDEFPRTPREG